MLRAIPCSSIGLSINDGRIPKKRSLSISVGAFLKKGHYRDFRSKFILLLLRLIMTLFLGMRPILISYYLSYFFKSKVYKKRVHQVLAIF